MKVILSIPDEGYSRNATYTLNYIQMYMYLLFKIQGNTLSVGEYYRSVPLLYLTPKSIERSFHKQNKKLVYQETVRFY